MKEIFYAIYKNNICPLLYLHDNQGTLLSTEWLTEDKKEETFLFHRIKWHQFEYKLKYYFDGQNTFFNINIKLDKLPQFTQKVLKLIKNIPYGTVMTYKEIAFQINSPKSLRAVGQACKKNPYPLIIPCHRVVSQNGLGGYSGQTQSGEKIDIKKGLLKLEGYL